MSHFQRTLGFVAALFFSASATAEDNYFQWHSALGRAFGVCWGNGYHQCPPEIAAGPTSFVQYPGVSNSSAFTGEYLPQDYFPQPTLIDDSFLAPPLSAREPESAPEPETRTVKDLGTSKKENQPKSMAPQPSDSESLPSPSDLPPAPKEIDELPQPLDERAAIWLGLEPSDELLLNPPSTPTNSQYARPPAQSIVQPNGLRSAARIKEPQSGFSNSRR